MCPQRNCTWSRAAGTFSWSFTALSVYFNVSYKYCFFSLLFSELLSAHTQGPLKEMREQGIFASILSPNWGHSSGSRCGLPSDLELHLPAPLPWLQVS